MWMVQSRGAAPGVVLLAAALLLGGARRGQAADHVVDSLLDGVDASPGDGRCATAAGDCTLRAAVLEANASPGADRILLGPGRHVLSLAGCLERDGLTGDLDSVGDLEILGAGRAETIITTDGEDRVLEAWSGRVRIADLTVEGAGLASCGLGGAFALADVRGRLERVSIQNCGSNEAVIVLFSTVELRDCVLQDNEGTGVLVEDSFLTVRESEFARNELMGEDFGRHAHLIAEEGSVVVIGDSVLRDGGGSCTGLATWRADLHAWSCIVSGNEKGGLELNGRSWLHRVVVEGNSATGEVIGGIRAEGRFAMVGSRVSDNVADLQDGGLNVRPTPQHASARLLRSTISGNVGAVGGIRAQVPLWLEACTVTSNVGGARVGGILLAVDEGLIHSSTITENQASSGVGGVWDFFATGNLRLSNSILHGNTAAGTPSDCGPGFELLGSNLIGSDEGCLLTGNTGGLLLGVDPMLAPLGAWGGSTPTRSPLDGSPAVDGGSDLPPGSSDEACSERGQRGVERPTGLRCDLGAVETCDDPSGLDSDADGILDACDLCPLTADDQRDQDRDGVGDACDPDCGAEPSAIDRLPLVEPFRVRRDPAHPVGRFFPADHPGWLTLTWHAEELESDHELVMGSLAALREGRYDHGGFGACGLSAGELDFLSPREDSYFLIVGRCGSQLSSSGRDSFGRERPEPIDACR